MSLQESLDQLKEFDFNDLDFERIGSWPLMGRAFVFFLAFVLVLGGFYFFKVKDLNVQLESLVSKEQSLKKTFNSRAHEAANLEAYRAQMIEMRESFGAMLSQLPKESEVPGLLEDITDRGAAAGLQFELIDLQKEATREFYVELPIKIKVVGNYHQLGTFVSGVSSLPRIVTLHDFDVNEIKETRGTLTMEIGAKTYRYKPQEE